MALLLFWLAGCGPKVYRGEDGLSPAEQVFARAEDAFNAGKFDEAIDLYSELVKRYPDSDMVPPALLKQGVSYGSLGAYDEAEGVLGRMASEHPESPFAPLALVESLTLSYRRGDYPAVIQKGVRIPDTLSPSDYRVAKYAIMGDAYLALGDRPDAVGAYFTAWDMALVSERAGVAGRLRKAVDRLTLDETLEILGRIHEKEKRGYLLFHRMGLQVEAGEPDAALQGVNDFLQLYSEHPVREEAVALRELLSSAHFNPRVLGCLLPFTGRYADYGKQARQGIELAFQDLAMGRGETGFQLVFRDTGSDDEMAAQAVRELVEAGAAAIIGPVGNAESATAEAQLRGVPMVAMSGKDGITAAGDFIFRNFMTRRMQVRSVAAYAFEVLGFNDFAILYPDEPYGRDFMHLFWDEVNRYGGEVRGVESYGAGTADFSRAIKKLTGNWYNWPEMGAGEPVWGRVLPEGVEDPGRGPDFEAIFIPDGIQSVELILPQLAFHDLGGIHTLGTNLWHDKALIKVVPGHLEHSVIPDGFFARSRDPRVQGFVAAFEGAFGKTPGYIEAVAYDSALLVLDVLASEAPASRSEVRDALLSVNGFPGVTGSTSFDGTGDADKDLTLLKGERRRFVEVTK